MLKKTGKNACFFIFFTYFCHWFYQRNRGLLNFLKKYFIIKTFLAIFWDFFLKEVIFTVFEGFSNINNFFDFTLNVDFSWFWICCNFKNFWSLSWFLFWRRYSNSPQFLCDKKIVFPYIGLWEDLRARRHWRTKLRCKIYPKFFGMHKWCQAATVRWKLAELKASKFAKNACLQNWKALNLQKMLNLQNLTKIPCAMQKNERNCGDCTGLYFAVPDDDLGCRAGVFL